ncbi:MAG: hypothetical protein WCR06_05135 [bacterium]
MEWVIGVVVLVAVGILFGRKLKFVPGCGTGVPSPASPRYAVER